MKRLAIAVPLALCVLASAVAAQVPQLVSYQGVLTDNSGNLVPDGAYDVTFRIFNVETGGAALYTETHAGTSAVGVVKGGFAVQLGELVALTLPFDVPYWLEIEVEGTGALTPRVRLTAAPYALMAKTVVNNAITSAKVLDNTLTGADIAAGAITSSELGTSSVTTAKILDNTILSSDIAAGAVGTSEVADNSISAADLLDEPGVAFLEGETNDNLYATPIILGGRSITVPAAGYVIAIANATMNIDHNSGTVSSVLMSVSTTLNVHNTDNQREIRLSNLLTDSGIYRFNLNVQDVFSVTAGSHDFYIVGSAPNGGVSSQEHSLLLMYVPTTYGGVTIPSEGPARVKTALGPDRP